jgi:hypothetical protein
VVKGKWVQEEQQLGSAALLGPATTLHAHVSAVYVLNGVIAGVVYLFSCWTGPCWVCWAFGTAEKGVDLTFQELAHIEGRWQEHVVQRRICCFLV